MQRRVEREVRYGVADGGGQFLQQCTARMAGSPDPDNGAGGCRIDERQGHEVVIAANGEFRQQGDACAAGDHLAQGFEAGGTKLVLVDAACQFAHFQRLVAQTVAVFQQQEVFVADIRFAHGPGCRQRVFTIDGKPERLFEQHLRLAAVEREWQGKNAEVDLAGVQFRHEVVGLQLEVEALQALESPGEHGATCGNR